MGVPAGAEPGVEARPRSARVRQARVDTRKRVQLDVPDDLKNLTEAYNAGLRDEQGRPLTMAATYLLALRTGLATLTGRREQGTVDLPSVLAEVQEAHEALREARADIKALGGALQILVASGVVSNDETEQALRRDYPERFVYARGVLQRGKGGAGGGRS